MTKAVKSLYNLGIGKEVVRGTKVAPSFWLQALSNDIQDRPEVVKTERSFGRIEMNADQAITKKLSQGTIESEVFDKSVGLFLLGAFGQVSTAGAGESGTYAHTFSVLQSAQHPTFTIVEKRVDNEQVAYANSVVESLGISFELNDYCKLSVNMRGKGKVADTSSPTYADENYFMAKNASVKVADTYDTLSSGEDICLKSLSLEINKNIEDDECLGNVEPVDFLNSAFEINGEMELHFNSVYERDWTLNNTLKAMRITLEDATTIIGTTLHPKLVIDLAKVKFSEPELSSDNAEIVRLTLKFTGYYSIEDGLAIQAVLTNEQATY